MSEKLYGYDIVDGKLVPNAEESEIVKFIYERNEYLSNNPPAELIQTVYEEGKELDPNYTMEQATEDAKHDGRLILYLTRDVNEKAAEIKPKTAIYTRKMTGDSKPCEPIVDQLTYMLVQAKQGQIDTVMVKSLERLCEDPVKRAEIIKQLEEYGVKIITE